MIQMTLFLAKRWAKFLRLETMFLKKKSSPLNEEYTHKLKLLLKRRAQPQMKKEAEFQSVETVDL